MEEEGTSQVQSHIINDRRDESSTEHQRNNTSRLLSLLSSVDRDFLLSPSGHQVKISDLEGTTVGLYFAANWYPQCRTFTNLLIQIYNHINSSAAVFEVIFVSSDEDSAAFSAFRSSMPWLSLPFSDLPTKKSLSHLFHIEAIPSLVVLLPSGSGDGDGVVLDGVELIYRYGAEAFPFTRERSEELKRRERERHETQTLVNLLTNRARDYVLAHPSPTKVSLSDPSLL